MASFNLEIGFFFLTWKFISFILLCQLQMKADLFFSPLNEVFQDISR